MSSDFFRLTTPGKVQRCTLNPLNTNTTQCGSANSLTNEVSVSPINDEGDEEITLTDTLGLALVTNSNTERVTVSR